MDSEPGTDGGARRAFVWARSRWRLVAAGLLLVAAVGTYWYLTRPPSRSGVEGIWGDAEVLAYEVRGGTPHIVLRERRDPSVSGIPNRIILDRLKLDRLSIGWPPVPEWQLSGGWETLSPTDDPASVGAAWGTGWSSHDSMELFGEINSPMIIAMEVHYEGEWHRFDVSPPGYMLQLLFFHGRPDGYRWLDASGATVWEAEDIQNSQEPTCGDERSSVVCPGEPSR